MSSCTTGRMSGHGHFCGPKDLLACTTRLRKPWNCNVLWSDVEAKSTILWTFHVLNQNFLGRNTPITSRLAVHFTSTSLVFCLTRLFHTHLSQYLGFAFNLESMSLVSMQKHFYYVLSFLLSLMNILYIVPSNFISHVDALP